MTQTIGSGLSAVQSIRLSDNPIRPVISVDARRALQVRWAYQARRLEQAVLTGNQLAEDDAMQVLVAIESEAMKNGVLEDLDTGDGSLASTGPLQSPMTARAAVGHRAEITGGYSRINALVWIPKCQQRGDGAELAPIILEEANGFGQRVGQVTNKPRKREKVKVDIMALGKRTIETTTPGAVVGGSGQVVPQSQVGKTAGVELSKAPGLLVSKAEQLKAMKKAAGKGAATAEGGNTKAPRAKSTKVKTPTLCLDGCGQTCGGRFAIGHDAKLKSLLIKIEKGEADISQVPEIVKPFVKFSKPVKVATGDGKGHTLTYQLLMAPVRMYGREDVEYVQDLGEAFGHK